MIPFSTKPPNHNTLFTQLPLTECLQHARPPARCWGKCKAIQGTALPSPLSPNGIKYKNQYYYVILTIGSQVGYFASREKSRFHPLSQASILSPQSRKRCWWELIRFNISWTTVPRSDVLGYKRKETECWGSWALSGLFAIFFLPRLRVRETWGYRLLGKDLCFLMWNQSGAQEETTRPP